MRPRLLATAFAPAAFASAAMTRFFLGALVVAGCGGPQSPPPPAHTGWTILYTARSGEGLGVARDVRPDVRIEVLDGRLRLLSAETSLDLRYDGPHARAWRCSGTCIAADPARAFAAGLGFEAEGPTPTVREAEPAVETLSEPQSIANVPTRGARFTVRYASSVGSFEASVVARWIDAPGDPSVEAVKDVFLAPLVRWGLARTVEQIRSVVGLPLAWELRVGAARSGEGTSFVFRAAALDNPPARIALPSPAASGS